MLRSRRAPVRALPADVAGMLGACSPAHVHEVLVLGVRLKNLLSRLIR